jgi:predicted ATP-dependent serine protease
MTLIKKSKLEKIGAVDVPDIFYNRRMSGLEELDYLFGGGALPGSTFTLCAQGGLGKTTLMLQLMQAYYDNDFNVGYVSGEESKYQIAFKCGHLGVHDVPVANITDVEEICQLIKDEDMDFLVIDSFQHLTTTTDKTGLTFQKWAVNQLCKAAQDNLCCVFIIMHVTKAGILAGSTYVPHTVDVNLQFRSGEDEYGDRKYRVLESSKNRFGSVDEIVTMMTGNGHVFTVDVQKKEQTPKQSKRSAAKQAEFDKILELSGMAITPIMIMEHLDVDYNHAYGRLAELTKNNKLKKIGRGQDAIFQVLKE